MRMSDWSSDVCSSDLLTRAVCGWAGVPLPATEVEARSRQLSALFDDAGHIGVGPLRSRAARRTADSWAADILESGRGTGRERGVQDGYVTMVGGAMNKN